MTAGRGIVHAEMPNQGFSDNVGMQLWVDLPAKLKTCEPRYRDLKASEIPKVDVDDGKVSIKIISGRSHGVDSVQELAYTPVWIFDVEMKPGSTLHQELPAGWNAFAYTLKGLTTFGAGDNATTAQQYHNVVFEQEGDEVVASVAEDATENSKFSKFLMSPWMYDDVLTAPSTCCGSTARPECSAVRAFRPQHQRRGISGHDGLPDPLERFRASCKLGERDWEEYGPLKGKFSM